MKFYPQKEVPTHWRQKSVLFFSCGRVELTVLGYVKTMPLPAKEILNFPCLIYHMQ